MDAKCSATNKNGSPCSAGPVREDGYCYWHSPDLADQRRTDRQRGGAARSNVARAKRQLPDAVLTPAELQGFIGLALRGVLAGRIEPGVANAVATLARAAVAVREATEVEERLTALETADTHGRRHG